MSDLERKNVTLQLKADDEGSFEAVFATFNVIDHDGDVTLPGAFAAGNDVIIGAFGHNMSALPTGKGAIWENKDEAGVTGRFFLDTGPGKDTYQTVKNLGPLQEWSYIYLPEKVSFGNFQERQVRFLEKVKVFSVDPVLAGAGINTRTTGIKSNEHVGLLADARDVLQRLKARAEFRKGESRDLSDAFKTQARELLDEVEVLSSELKDLLAEVNPEDQDELFKLRLKFLKQEFEETRAKLGVA